MNTIVMNLDSLAITEYTPAFTGLSGDYEALVSGVYRVGGTTDNGTKISSRFELGLASSEGGRGRQQRPRYLYLYGTGASGASATMTDGKARTYTYANQQVHDRVSRFVLGAGARDTYLGIAVTFPGNYAVDIDRIEFETAVSATRRM